MTPMLGLGKSLVKNGVSFLTPPQLWTPSLTSTALWLDADDSSTITLNYVSPTGNLVPQPENAGAWTAASGAFTLDQTTAPNNTLTADLFTPTAVNAYFVPAPTQPANVEYTFSLYLKNNGLTSVNVLAGGGGNNYGYTINLVTGAVSWVGATAQQPVTSVAVVNCGNDWFNVAMTTTALNPVLFLMSAPSNVNSINGVFTWGAQIITGSSKMRYKSPQVAQWSDKSGNGLHVSQATAGLQPTYSATGMLIKPALDWDTVPNDKVLTRAISGYTAQRYFGVADWDGPDPFTNFCAVLSHGPSTGITPSDRVMTANSGQGWLASSQYHLNGGAASSIALPTISSPFIFSTTFGPQSGRTGLFVGTDITTGNLRGWLGKISEIIAIDFVPTTKERERIEGYLAWKWGLVAKLPSGHPYKNSPPIV